MSSLLARKSVGRPLEIWITIANSAAQAWYGYDQGIIAGILIASHFIDTFPQTKDPNVSGITSSCFSLGNFVGCIIAATFGDKLGRRKTLLSGAFLSVVGAILQFTAFDFAQFIVGRVLNGLGNGMTSSTCGIYQAESCKSERRGVLMVIVVLHNVVFYCIGSWLTFGTFFIHDSSAQWRFPLAFQLVLPIVMSLTLPFLPESPRWLLLHDRYDEGRDVIRRLLGGATVLEEDVDFEYNSILGAIELERKSKISFKDVMLMKDRSGHLKRLLLGMGGQFMQQFGGINALNYYLPTVFTENIGLSELMARLLTGVNSIVYVFSSWACIWMIERFGRRNLMIAGSALQCFSYVMVAIALGVATKAASYQMGAVAVTFLFFFYFAFGGTWGMVPWVYQAEINSLAMRTRGAAAATATNWMGSFICVQFTPPGLENISWKFYIIFAVFNMCFIPIVYFLYPETSNRSLEDLDAYFDVDSGNSLFILPSNSVARQTRRPIELIEEERKRVDATMRAHDDSKLGAELDAKAPGNQKKIADNSSRDDVAVDVVPAAQNGA